MLGIIYRDYLCSKEEKDELIQKEKIELERIENEKSKRYDTNNIFKKNNYNSEAKENPNMKNYNIVEYKESILKRILNKLKSIFHINKLK